MRGGRDLLMGFSGLKWNWLVKTDDGEWGFGQLSLVQSGWV